MLDFENFFILILFFFFFSLLLYRLDGAFNSFVMRWVWPSAPDNRASHNVQETDQSGLSEHTLQTPGMLFNHFDFFFF